MAKQTTTPQIDEDFMKDIISQGFPMKRERERENKTVAPIPEEEPEILPEVAITTEKPRRKKEVKSEYVERYFERVDFSDRQLVYITRETHQRLTDIVNVIGGKQGTIGGYIENIIRDHFENHKEEVNTIYASRFRKPL